MSNYSESWEVDFNYLSSSYFRGPMAKFVLAFDKATMALFMVLEDYIFGTEIQPLAQGSIYYFLMLLILVVIL